MFYSRRTGRFQWKKLATGGRDKFGTCCQASGGTHVRMKQVGQVQILPRAFISVLASVQEVESSSGVVARTNYGLAIRNRRGTA